ncbi:ABC-three component system middle component 1 [Bacillus toyonensis]|uniref:ABC-three component system middle component 1 n=1 Tax=Bacillus toyonensis TaxID=155322 RepID=UPI000BF3528D|nr:ABC-three component system middle component 1 [Bacillus toyonensis]PGD17959.1 hypothetical protein COM35_04925 [Bacillus toyonensis]
MKKSELISILNSNNFIVSKSELFIKKDNKEYIYCFNKAINTGFIIKKYQHFDYENILEDVIDIFLFLKKNEINIWNTYYMILLELDEDPPEKHSDFYKIERNSQGLRKYVIMTQEDLYRIPFLFNLQEKGELNHISNLRGFLHTGEKEVDDFIEWVIEEVENDGIKKSDVKMRVDNLMGVNKNES